MWQHLRNCLDNASGSGEQASKVAGEQKSADEKTDGKRPFPLSFVVVVPGWTEGDCWAHLSTSPCLLRAPLAHMPHSWLRMLRIILSDYSHWMLRRAPCCARPVPLVHQRAHWCRYLRFKLVVAAEDHGFCDGASHQRKDPYRESPYDTAVFVLQTEAGARKWPVTAGASDEGVSLKEALVRAFAQGRPTAAAKKRQKR